MVTMQYTTVHELANDPRARLFIVARAADPAGVISEETQATYQKVMDIIHATGREIIDPNDYLTTRSNNGKPTITPEQLSVLSTTYLEEYNSLAIISTEPELKDCKKSNVIFLSDVAISVAGNVVKLVRSKHWPTFIELRL